MSSVVKSIGKAVKKVGKAIGKFVKKALPIIIIAAVIYFTGGAGAGVAAAGGGKAAAGAALATGAATSAASVGGVATTVGGISGAGGAGAVSGAVGGATSAAAPVASNALVGPEIAAAGGATGNTAQALGAVGSGTSGAAATGLGASTYSLPSAGAITKTPIGQSVPSKYLPSQSWGANPINRGAAQGATQAAGEAGVVTQSGLGTIGTSGGIQPQGITGASGLSETGSSLMAPSANPVGTVTIKSEAIKSLVSSTNVSGNTPVNTFAKNFEMKVGEWKTRIGDFINGRPVTNEAGQIISRQGGLLGQGGFLGEGGWVERNPAVSEMLGKGIGAMAQTAMAEEEYEPPREYFMTKPDGPPVSMEQARQLIGGQPTQPRGYLQSTPQQQMKKNQQLLRNTQLVPSPTAPQGY